MNRRGLALLFWFTLALALAAECAPLPLSLSVARPFWLALVLGYWALYGPNVAVIASAMLLGLAADTYYDTPLGQHVLALTLLVYSLIRLRPVLGLYPTWQVTLLLIPAWLLFGLTLFVMDGMARHPSLASARFLPAASSALLWPLVVALIDSLRGQRAPI